MGEPDVKCDTCGRLYVRKRIHVPPPMTTEEFYSACVAQGSEDCLGVALNTTRVQLAEATRERDEWRELADRCDDVTELKDKLATTVAALEWYEDYGAGAAKEPKALPSQGVAIGMLQYDGGGRARQALAAIRAGTPRPAPLSPEAHNARKPPPPDALVDALQDRVHVERGELIASQPIRAGEGKTPSKYAGAKPIEGEPVCALCNTPAGLHDEETCSFEFTPSAGEAECNGCSKGPGDSEPNEDCPQHGKAKESQ